jgi:hypothetical protein
MRRKRCFYRRIFVLAVAIVLLMFTTFDCAICYSGGNSLFSSGGGKASYISDKTFIFPTTPPPPFALEKAVFSPFLGQKFRKFVIFRESGRGGGRPPTPLRFPPLDLDTSGKKSVIYTFYTILACKQTLRERTSAVKHQNWDCAPCIN